MTYLMDTVRFRKLGITSGRGASLLNELDKRSYLDFFCDVGTASLGYSSAEMADALHAIEADGIIHSPVLFEHMTRERAAAQVCILTGMDRVFFCNSGAEAVEAAIKVVRKRWWEQHDHKDVLGDVINGVIPQIWTAQGGFHGRTLAGISAGDGPAYHRAGFGPLPKGFYHFKDWREVPKDAAAVMLAPVFGNNDVREYSWEWLAGLREYTAKNGIPLIFDEVQTGAGRTGFTTYAERIGVKPDIITLGKGIAMGAPVGLMLARGSLAHVLQPGTHFSTFGGNPLCCHFLLGMLDWLSGDEGPAHLKRVEDVGIEIFHQLQGCGNVDDVRRVGMLIAADVRCDTLKLAQRCEDSGLLLGAFRQGPGPLKITPPLNITDKELEAGMRILITELAKGD